MGEKRRCTASEREGIMRLALLAGLAEEVLSTLGKRAQTVPGLKRDLCMVRSKSRKMLTRVLDTLPPEQLPSIEHHVKMCSYVIGARRPGERGKSDYSNYGVWLSFNMLETLLAALKDHCMMCNLDRATEYQCQLKRTLDILGTDIEHGGSCGYRIHLR